MMGFQFSEPESRQGAHQVNDLLACSEFVKVFRKHIDRPLIQDELNALGEFFVRAAPIRRDVVVTTLERAVLVKGGDLHLRYYLEQLEQSIRRK